MSSNYQNQRRDQGEREPKGKTKRKILLKLAQEFPQDVEEPPLRDYLKENFRISSNKGIKNHLSDLKQENCLKKESTKGKANIWNLNQEYEGFKSLCKLFLDSSDRGEFLKSDYAQKMLDKFLQRQIEDFKQYLKENDVLEDDVIEWVDIFLGNPDIFRKFPIGLYYLMFPSELEKELSVFREMEEEKGEDFERFGELFVQNITEEQIEKWEKMFDLVEQRIEKMRERFGTIKQKWEGGEIGNDSSE